MSETWHHMESLFCLGSAGLSIGSFFYFAYQKSTLAKVHHKYSHLDLARNNSFKIDADSKSSDEESGLRLERGNESDYPNGRIKKRKYRFGLFIFYELKKE